MRKVSSKQAFYGFCGGIVIAFITTGLLTYWANGQLDLRKSQINQKKTESQELDNKINRAKSLREELLRLQDINQTSTEVLPNIKSQENIIGELISIAAKRGLSLESIAFSGGGDSKAGANPETSQSIAVKEVPGVFGLSIQTSITTDYENVLQFLEDLENNKRQFEVTEISITPDPVDTSLFTTQLSLVTYIQP